MSFCGNLLKTQTTLLTLRGTILVKGVCALLKNILSMTFNYKDLSPPLVATVWLLNRITRFSSLDARVNFEDLYEFYLSGLSNFGPVAGSVEIDIHTFLEICLIQFEIWSRQKQKKIAVELSWINEIGDRCTDYIAFPLDTEAFSIILNDGGSDIIFCGVKLVS